MKLQLIPYSTSPADILGLTRQALENARLEARITINNASKKAATRIKNLRKRAYRNAFIQAQKNAKIQLQNEFLKLHSQYEQIVQTANQDCLGLAISLAEEIISENLQFNRQSLAFRIERSIQNLIDLRSLKINLNPSDVAEVDQQLSRLLADSSYQIVTNSNIAQGNAIIETISGSVELNWSEHLDILKERMQKKLQENLQDNLQNNLQNNMQNETGVSQC